MQTKALIKRHTSLSAQLIDFCRYLRNNGFNLGSQEEADALMALSTLPHAFQNSDDFQECLRALLVRSLPQQINFDRLYDEYFDELNRAVDSKIKKGKDAKKKAPKKEKRPDQKPSIKALKNWLYGNKPDDETEIAAYSNLEIITQKDFASFTENELDEVAKLIKAIARSLATKYKRRNQKNHKGSFDLRRSLRLNMRRGGEIIDIAFSKPKKEKLKILLLCDVSKSMELYSRFLIQFIYAFQNTYRNIDTFVFSTQLHHISAQLKSSDIHTALEAIGETVPDWSGGTRIGASLQTFMEEHAGRKLDKKTIVIIMSDGWDTGDADLLSSNMEKIHKKAARVIWLNPLAGNPAFKAATKGMESAMPFIDVFAPVHNLASLRRTFSYLGKRK